MNAAAASTPAPSPRIDEVISCWFSPCGPGRYHSSAMPIAVKPSWPMNSAVTSAAVVEMATAGSTPPRIAARAPKTKPPSDENGSSSPDASRTSRAK